MDETRVKKALSLILEHVYGEKKSDCALIIPYADTPEMLMEHLNALEKQTTDNFDLILICSDPPKISSKFNIRGYREIFPIGSSGGFGVGQALAYSLGYEFIINSDVDALPVSENLIITLVERAKKEKDKSVIPLFVSKETGEKDGNGSGNPNQYGTCTRKSIERNGFECFRLFKGSEDMEYLDRQTMDNAIVLEDSVKIQHKCTMVDYIEIQNIRGSKGIYYKKSEVIANIFLCRAALSRKRLRAAFTYAARALFSAVKTQLFYSNYPDVLRPITKDAIFAKMEIVSPFRTSQLKKIQTGGQLKAATVGMQRGNAGAMVRFPKKKHGSVLWPLILAAFSKGDYFSPDGDFFLERPELLPLLLVFKPVKYKDGAIYSIGLSTTGFFLNLAATLFLTPYFAAAIAWTIATADKSKCPITTENLAENLEKFAAYVKRMKTEGDALRGN